MNALLGPKNRMRDGKKWEWGLLVHTVALFLVTTIYAASSLYGLEESYINGRESPGGDGIPPGPYGYQYLPKFLAVRFISYSAVQMNQWLADGLLVSSTPNSATRISDLGHLYSCIVATSFSA
jgi:hypothetical protein